MKNAPYSKWRKTPLPSDRTNKATKKISFPRLLGKLKQLRLLMFKTLENNNWKRTNLSANVLELIPRLCLFKNISNSLKSICLKMRRWKNKSLKTSTRILALIRYKYWATCVPSTKIWTSAKTSLKDRSHNQPTKKKTVMTKMACL